MAETTAPPTRASGPRRPIRPRELEDTLNYRLYHPLAWRLARILARTPVSPNMVSIAGGLTVVAAGLAYAGALGPGWPGSAPLGLALHMTWHVLDGADGDLARMTGRASPLGEMIDGLCDYASHFVLYLLLGWILSGEIGWIAWPAVVATGLAHAVQSNHVEVQRRFYLYWIYDKPWLNNQRSPASGPLGWLVALYLRVAAGLSPHSLAIDRAVTAAAGDPPRLEQVRAAILAESRQLLRIEKLLHPNQRAIVLGLSMLLTASPLAYLAFVALWLSALLAVSVVTHDRAAQRIAAKIAEPG